MQITCGRTGRRRSAALTQPLSYVSMTCAATVDVHGSTANDTANLMLEWVQL